MEIFLYVIIFLDLKTINAFIQLDSYQSYLFLFFDFLSQLKAFLIKIQWNRTVEDLFFRIWLSSKVWGRVPLKFRRSQASLPVATNNEFCEFIIWYATGLVRGDPLRPQKNFNSYEVDDEKIKTRYYKKVSFNWWAGKTVR